MNTEPSVFTRIINREIPADIVLETETVIVIKDIAQVARVHLLGITKKPLQSMHDMCDDEAHKDLLWDLFSALHTAAEQFGVDKTGYRLVTNVGPDSHQSVPHLHVHLLGGEELPQFGL